MKHRLVWTLLSALVLVGCVAAPAATPTHMPPTPTATLPPAPTWTPAPAEADRGAPAWVWTDLDPYRQAMRPAYAGDVDAYAGATRYAIDVQIDLENASLRGTQWVRYVNQEDVALDQIVFRLLPNTPSYGGALIVSTLSVAGAETLFELELDDSALYVPLQTPLAPSDQVELELAFEGAYPTDDSAGYAQYGYFDQVLALPAFYPLIPVYDDEGWNVELAPPYGDATFSDTSLYQFRFTLPADLVPAVSGTIVERQENGDGTMTYVAASGPMREVNLVASARYEQAVEHVGEILVTSYYLPSDAAGGERALDYAVRSLEIYQNMIGPYPFAELDVMATPTKAGGIEYPGLIVVAASLYDEEGGFFEFASVHEVAHQWWYSMVGSDQLDEPWLDEALTQYTSLLYFERRYGPQAGRSVLEQSFEGNYERLQETDQDMPAGLPVEAYPENLYGAVVYGKGPLFFHAMRQQVGDETFYQILRTYFDRYRYDVAYPQDLLAVAQEVSGQDLSPLYRQWIAGQN